MEDTTPIQDTQSTNLLIFIWRHRKLIFLITGIATVVSLSISLLMTPIYKSTAIIFPTATSTVSFSEQRNAKAAAMDFGEEEQAEQMVQILQSARIRDRIVAEFDLMKHYEISENASDKYHKLGKAYSNHFLFTRTRYGSIQIDVLDRDPELAANMANRIVVLYDTVKNEMIKERTWVAFEISKRKMDQLLLERKEMINSIDSLAARGVVPAAVRSNLYQAYVDSKNESEKRELYQAIIINRELGPLFDVLMNSLTEKDVSIEKFKDAYEQAESDAYAIFSHKFVVENAVVADKKHKPKRLVIVLLGMIGGFLFTVFALLIRARLQELKQAA